MMPPMQQHYPQNGDGSFREKRVLDRGRLSTERNKEADINAGKMFSTIINDSLNSD